MQLVVVRHGETIENINQIIQGNLDGTLSEKGKEQAEQLADNLKNEEFDQIFSSDLGRALNTAKPIMDFHTNQKLKLTSALREMSFGEIQGQYSRSVHWDSVPGSIITKKFPKGESALEMAERVLRFVNKLLEKYHDQKILMVTHGGPIRALRSAIEQIDFESLYAESPENVSIWRFEIDKPLKLHHG